MTNFINKLFRVAWVVMWVAGVVLAKGFWSTLFAVFTWGLWSLYLVVEMGLRVLGVVA